MDACWIEELCSPAFLLLSNTKPDTEVINFVSNDQLNQHMASIFSNASNIIQVMCANNNKTSKDACPFFRIVMGDYDSKGPVNYKLQTLLRGAGVDDISVRCGFAVVIGMSGMWCLENTVDIPLTFRLQDMDKITWEESFKQRDSSINIPSK